MKSGSPIISAVVFGLALFLVLIFGAGSTPPEGAEPVVAAAPLEASTALSHRPLPEAPPTARPGYRGLMLEAPKLLTASSRASASAALSGLIVNQEGSSLAGAELIWAPLEADSPRLRATTQEGGRFRFDSAPQALIDQRSAVWILHPSHYAEAVLLEPGTEPSVAFGGTHAEEVCELTVGVFKRTQHQVIATLQKLSSVAVIREPKVE